MRLPDVEAGGHRECAEADAVGAAGDADAPRLADDLTTAGGGQRRPPPPPSRLAQPCLATRRVLLEHGGEAHLAQGVARGGDDPVAVGAVRANPEAARNARAALGVGEQPQGDRLGPGLGEHVHAGVEQAGAVALAAGVRVDRQEGHLAGRRAGIRVLRGADRRETDDLVAGARDEQAVHSLGRGREALAPGAREGVRLELGHHLIRDPSRHVSRKTVACTIPTAGASFARARRTLASASRARGSGRVVARGRARCRGRPGEGWARQSPGRPVRGDPGTLGGPRRGRRWPRPARTPPRSGPPRRGCRGGRRSPTLRPGLAERS